MDFAVQFQERVRTETTRISFATAGRVERPHNSLLAGSVRRHRKILRLTDELESKQEFIETLNQKLNELQTISGKLKGAQDKIKNSLWDEIPTGFGKQ